MIDNLNDYCQTICVFTVGKEHHTADLDKPPLGGCDLDLGHTGGVSTMTCQYTISDSYRVAVRSLHYSLSKKSRGR